MNTSTTATKTISKRQMKRNLLAATIKAVKEMLKAVIKSIHIASTGSCYIKVNTKDGVKKIRIADHRGYANAHNDLELRVDLTKRNGEMFPCNKIENAINRLNNKFGLELA